MPEELFAIRPSVRGGRGDFSRSDIRMAIMAIRRFGISDDLRQKMVKHGETILDSSPDEKTKLLAIKMLAEMDKIDATREGNAIQQRHHEVLEATVVLRAAMQGENVRTKLAELSEQVCTPLSIEDINEIEKIQQNNAEEVLAGISKIGETNGTTNGKHHP